MDVTLERGPKVAATKGIAVEANHQRLSTVSIAAKLDFNVH
jgi:hypothetical protein